MRFQPRRLDSDTRRRLSFENMCGRFARRSTQEVLAGWFGVELEDIPWFGPTFNAAPQSVQPVVRMNRDSGQREIAQLRWGLVPFWILLANSVT
jgi:putative SOS response-associated peptidase YedK